MDDPPGAPVPARATVLVVEDEASVRLIVERMLAMAGHRVITCASGEEAIELVARNDGPLDVLLTDLLLGGIDGVEVADRVRRLRPGIGVVFTSGGHEQDVADRRPVPGSLFLRKPFSREEVQGAVAAVLPPARET